jgi:hypothetical protein
MSCIENTTVNLPRLRDNDHFRRVSQTKAFQSPGYVPLKPFLSLTTGKQRCHRVPNKELYEAYEKAPSDDVRMKILEFNYDQSNIRTDVYNSQHSEAEEHIRTGNASAADVEMKANQVASALDSQFFSGDDETRGHILRTLSEKSGDWRDIVASLDKRVFNTPGTKAAIDSARTRNPSSARTSKMKDYCTSATDNRFVDYDVFRRSTVISSAATVTSSVENYDVFSSGGRSDTYCDPRVGVYYEPVQLHWSGYAFF